MFNLLGNSLLPNWVVNSFPVIKFILLVLILIAAVALIVFVALSAKQCFKKTTNKEEQKA